MLRLFGVDLDNLMKMPGQRGRGSGATTSCCRRPTLSASSHGGVKDVRVAGDRLEMVMVGDAKPLPARDAAGAVGPTISTFTAATSASASSR